MHTLFLQQLIPISHLQPGSEDIETILIFYANCASMHLKANFQAVTLMRIMTNDLHSHNENTRNELEWWMLPYFNLEKQVAKVTVFIKLCNFLTA